MGYEDWRNHDSGDPNGIIGFLEELIEAEAVEGPALGVTKRFIASGYDSLTSKQKVVFDRFVIDEFATKSCELCGGDIPWCEMWVAYDNGHFCSWCEHGLNKGD